MHRRRDCRVKTTFALGVKGSFLGKLGALSVFAALSASKTACKLILLLFGVFFLVGQAVAASELRLDLPIRCVLGHDCFIQNYFDHDSSPGWRDYACGRLSYDRHAGTDFRLKSHRQLLDGVEVIAAASGTVQAVRAGEPDVSIRQQPLDSVNPKDAGNGVRIAHDNGWETQYSHLRHASIRVRPGQIVQAGEVLGLVGLSGNTEFPHVDFTVRKDGIPVDPFGLERKACGSTASTLWSDAALHQLAYQPTAIVLAGYADRVLTTRELESGDHFQSSFSDRASALVFHVEVMGARQGDIETLRITSSNGKLVAERVKEIGKDFALLQSYLGKRTPDAAWPAGEYIGHYALQRDQSVIATIFVRIDVIH